MFSLSQQVDGVSYNDYVASQALFDNVFTKSIAASIEGVNEEDITNLVVTPVSRRRLLSTSIHTENAEEPLSADKDKEIGAVDTTYLRSSAHRKRTTLNGAVSLRYTIEIPRNRGLTYTQMAALLQESVTTNQFTSLLQSFAAQYNVPELRDATSSSVSTQDTSPIQESDNNKESSDFTIELIVGLVIGAILVILVLFGIAYYITNGAIVGAIYRCLCPCFTTSNNAANNQLQGKICHIFMVCVLGVVFFHFDLIFVTFVTFSFATASAPPLADPTISKDINLYFSGDLSIHNAPGGGNTSEQALNSGFSPRDMYSAHRPHAPQPANPSKLL